jgi:hypothetical protein
VAILASLPGLAFLHGQEKGPPGKEPPKESAKAPNKPQAWALDEAMDQLRLYPKDAYLQYVALQLARREKTIDKVGNEVEQIVNRANGFGRFNQRTEEVDLFSLFTGALAVQESLQLDSMRGQGARRPRIESS